MRLPGTNLLLLLSFIGINKASAQQTSLLKGTVTGRDSKIIYLLPRTQRADAAAKIEIPITNGHFEYKLTSPDMKAYQLIFKDEYDRSVWNAIYFFPDTAEVNFYLHGFEEAEKNIIAGGNINRELQQFKKQQEQLFGARQQKINEANHKLWDEKKLNSPAYDSLRIKAMKAEDVYVSKEYYEQMNQLEKQGKHLTPEGELWTRQSDSLKQDIINWKYKLLNEKVTFAHYYILLEDVRFFATNNKPLVNAIKKTYQQYVDAYPQHEYSQMIKDCMGGLLQIYPGNKFIDFSAPDLNGKVQKMSDLVQGKMALIDLWGSWCGSCIAKARKVVPLYEKYKDKGFTVVGVAREFKDTKALHRQLKMEQFNWQHLVELDDKNGIWNKYGAQNNAGLVVLIDAEGKILAVDPSVEELQGFLAKLD